ncbi:MAG: DMT family transporter [Chloroflexales bacterium]|nr:DMT family transporter [Chloroflexales bacterium]
MHIQSLSASVRHVFCRTTILSSAAILSAACWGLGTVMSRAVLDTLPPFTLLVIQLGSSVLFLSLLSTISGKPPITSVRELRAGLSGLLEPGLAYLLGTLGLALTTASSASLIGAIEPVAVIGFAWLFLRERITWRIGLLALIAVIGVGLVSASDGAASHRGSVGGDLLILLGTLAAALYVVATRRLLGDREPLTLTLVQQTVGLFGVAALWLAASFFQHPVAALPPVAPSIFLQAIISGIIQYALAFWLYLIALRGLPASIAAFYLTLIPLFGVGGASVFLGERLTFWQGIGAACILGTLILLSARRQAEHQEYEGC